MNAGVRRSSVLAGVAMAVLAIGGCGGSNSQHRRQRAVFAAPGLGAGSRQARAPRATGSSAASSNPGTTSTASTTAPTDTIATATSPRTGTAGGAGTAGPRADSAPAAKVTFAAPGGESHAQFVSAADAICRSFRARARAIGTAATTLGAQETELRKLVTATEQSVKALTDLSPPNADAAGLRRFAEMTVAAVIAFAQAQSRTSSTSESVGSQVEASDLADSGRSAHDAAAAQAAARTLRLHICGSSGSAWL
jgi:hypothetical protein